MSMELGTFNITQFRRINWLSIFAKQASMNSEITKASTLGLALNLNDWTKSSFEDVKTALSS